MKVTLLIAMLSCFCICNSVAQTERTHNSNSNGQTNPAKAGPLMVKRCRNFELTGKGNNPEWDKAAWNVLTKLDTGGRNYDSRFKILYSNTGIYLFFSGEDDVITTGYDQDFGDLYKADVFEAFFHTEPKTPLYFEYEINQLDKELVLIIPNLKNSFYGWIPWHYENERRVKKMISITGGKMESNSRITSWSAELFFPFALFKPLENVPPAGGTVWNANFYRIDYDSGIIKRWAWAPVEKSFHAFEKFLQIVFE